MSLADETRAHELTDSDIYLFRQGRHHRLYEKLGAHALADGGVRFAVWAPNAAEVCVVGDFNEWRAGTHPLQPRTDGSGIWEGMLPGAGVGTRYKYHLRSNFGDYAVDKADPFARQFERPPLTAAIVADPRHVWQDEAWMRSRAARNALDAPFSIYEMHLGSWRRVPEQANRFLTYRELAEQLPGYLNESGFTHVEFLPVMEHPFYGSWGYQTTGYFAPTARYGSAQDFQLLIDRLHQAGIGVILDWVPSHFPNDEHGLTYFDGTHLYEHADPKQGFHPEWKSSLFNYGREEVRAFLISSAFYWLDHFHADGLRVDAVASMLYLDYARNPGEWIANEHGGRENLHAMRLLRELNEAAYGSYADTQTIAEESTAWPMVSRPLYLGGLGFGMKWNMGWMHDTLAYFARDPIYRHYHHSQITFSIWYAFNENFVLPLSHDEVVYGKGSLLHKMAGDDWQRFANLRLLLGFQYMHPGKKLLMMGSEFGQWNEWNHDSSLDWHLLDDPRHRGVHRLVGDLNRLHRELPALHQLDFSAETFEWIDQNDAERSVLSFLRKGRKGADPVLVACNFTPVPRHNYRVGAPRGGPWREILNSDARWYGGSGQGNLGALEAAPLPMHGRYHSLSVTLPPLAIVCLQPA
jgi:1,4-alpha-glucan branching enzyme